MALNKGNITLENVTIGMTVGAAVVRENNVLHAAPGYLMNGSHVLVGTGDLENPVQPMLGALILSGEPHGYVTGKISLKAGCKYRITGTVTPAMATIYISSTEVISYDTLSSTIIHSCPSDSEGQWGILVESWLGDAIIWCEVHPSGTGFLSTSFTWTAEEIIPMDSSGGSTGGGDTGGDTGGGDTGDSGDGGDTGDSGEGGDTGDSGGGGDSGGDGGTGEGGGSGDSGDGDISGEDPGGGDDSENETTGDRISGASGGTATESCETCNGAGYVWGICTACDGFGHAPAECPNCGGSGLASDSSNTLVQFSSTIVTSAGATSCSYPSYTQQSGATMIAGSKMAVSFDGAEYGDSAKESDEDDEILSGISTSTMTYIGNYSLVGSGGENTGEPFFYAIGDHSTYGSIVLIVTTEAGSHSLHIIDASCSACGGKGVYYTTTACTECDAGAAQVPCPDCNGTGKVGGKCVTGDTMITLADRSRKRIDCMDGTELVLCESGTATKIIGVFRGFWNHNFVRYTFEDGTIINEVKAHRFFNVEQGFWQILNRWKIGEHAVREDGSYVALVSKERISRPREMFGLWTESGDYYANGLLSGETAANQRLLANATLEQAVDMIAGLDERYIIRLAGLEGMFP